MFVVQKHAARRLHYDFRLEMEGVLRSWAVPKGPSLNPRERRLAVMVEDHPIEYGDFEGLIPEGSYGTAAVIVWDRGRYRAMDPPGDPAAGVRAGKLDFELHGFKLRGAYALVRTHGMRGAAPGKPQWLLIKKRDASASDEDVLAAHPRSVLSGLTVEEIRQASEVGAEVSRELENSKALVLEAWLRFEAFPLSLAKLVREPFDNEGWVFELKYDGARALAIRNGAKAQIFARSGNEITSQYPEIARGLDALPFGRFVMDGEIVVFDERCRSNFQMLQRRIGVTGARGIQQLSLSLPVFYYVFDLLAFDRFDLRPLELETRKAILARIIKGEGAVRYCDHVVGRGSDFYRAVAKANLEGIIAKRRSSPYRARRSEDWLKIKCPQTGRFVIGGFTEPAGSRMYFGALLLGQYEANGELRFVGRAGTGFDEMKLRKLFALMKASARKDSPFRRTARGEPSIPRGVHFCEPELVCEVRFTEWTDHGGLRQPSFQRLVEDASARECTYAGPRRGELRLKHGAKPRTAPASSSSPAAVGAGTQ
jgi:bifunctional non-homologous end joining protein LigD